MSAAVPADATIVAPAKEIANKAILNTEGEIVKPVFTRRLCPGNTPNDYIKIRAGMSQVRSTRKTTYLSAALREMTAVSKSLG
jgi:hypothetical protein